MIEKLVRDDRAVQVRFVVPAVMADGEVTVAGEFNGWDTAATPLRGDGEVRTATMVLEPGHKYEFRYCVNGLVQRRRCRRLRAERVRWPQWGHRPHRRIVTLPSSLHAFGLGGWPPR